MKLLNVACGAVRAQAEEWWNLDMLRPHLAPGSPERIQLDSEPRYVEHDLSAGAELPFEENTFDGCLLSHVIEHFDCWAGLEIIRKCFRILKPEGHCMVSVPNATYFRKVYEEDNVENAVRLFGEPIHLPDGHVTFFNYALWYNQHRVILSEDTLWAYFAKAGFEGMWRVNPDHNEFSPESSVSKMWEILNRRPFSLVMTAWKP